MGDKISIEELHRTNTSLKKQIEHLEYTEEINHALYDISNAINTTLNLEELYQSVHNSLNLLLNLPNFYIALCDEQTNTINFDYFVDQFDNDAPIAMDILNPNSLTSEVIHEQRPLFLKENKLLERSKKHKIIGTIPKVWIGIPLIIQDKTIGVICTQNYSDPEYFSHQHFEIFTSVADQIAIAIERKQILDALEIKGKTLDLITNNTSAFVFVIDTKGISEFVNPTHRHLDYDPKDLVGTSYFDLVHPDDIEKVLSFLKIGMNGPKKATKLKFRVQNKQKSFHILEGIFDIVKNEDGFLEKIIFIGEDVTAKETSQKALDDIEERFGLIFDACPDSIMISDLEDGTIFDVNQAFTQLSGLSQNEIIGKTTIEIGFWRDKAQRSSFVSVLKKRGEYKNYQIKVYFNRTTSISALVSSNLVYLKNKPLILSIIKDISDIIIRKDQLKQDKETILVVEDEDMVREMAIEALKSFGYHTLGAADGVEGLKIFKEYYRTIDAVLLDIIMPKMSGAKTFQKMLEIDPNVKVIIASGHITDKDQKKIFTKAKGYLNKPYLIMDLKQALRSLFY